MRRAPLSPLMSRCQVGSTPHASGVTMPSPVTTTRLICKTYGTVRQILYAPGATARQGHVRCQRRGEFAKRRNLTFRVLLKELDGVADRQNGLGGIIRNLATEFFLKRHDEFHRVEAVGAEIVNEACIFGNLVGFDSQMLYDDFFHPLANVAHRCNLVSFGLGSIGQRPRAVAVWACVVSVGSSRSRADPCDDWPRYAPSKPRFGYHTSKALTSAPASHPRPRRAVPTRLNSSPSRH